ncbi:MAG: hypothetical protein AB8I08_14360 [Sandaracinaceae bacterium]
MRSLALAFLSCLLAAPAAAQDPDDLRLGGHFALGVLGEADASIGGLSGSAELDPTLGFGARVDLPVHDYVAIGGQLELLFFDQGRADREAVFDFNAYVRLRYAIELSRDSMWIEPYVQLPFGLALAAFQEGDDVWPGFNTGALAGAWFIFDFPLSFYAEVGWRHHQVFSEQRVLGADVDLKVVTNQLAMNAGVSLILE